MKGRYLNQNKETRTTKLRGTLAGTAGSRKRHCSTNRVENKTGHVPGTMVRSKANHARGARYLRL